jgi:glycogen debranching enzyme
MARPLAPGSISRTAAGAALVTDANGDIHANAVEGLFVDDIRMISQWHLTHGEVVARLVGEQRNGPSEDRLLFTLSVAGTIDPVALLERRRCVRGNGFDETISITTFSRPLRTGLEVTMQRDDQTVLSIGEPVTSSKLPVPIDSGDGCSLDGLGGPCVVAAPGWRSTSNGLAIDVDVVADTTWSTTVAVTAPTMGRSVVSGVASTTVVRSSEPTLDAQIAAARDDLRALTMPIGEHDVLAAGSPFFLALFGRDSMIAGTQFLIDSVDPLCDVLSVLAAHQADRVDAVTGAQPGRILHELRVGRAGVFGVQPGHAYYGSVDAPAFFVVAAGEAWRWGAPMSRIAALLPAMRSAVAWCRGAGDVDDDGFVESVPHRTGLVNLGWKDSGDSMLDEHGRTVVASVALCEVQAYWYRALRTLADIERAVGESDGAELDDEAAQLAERFREQFVYNTPDGPFVGLALDGDKQLLRVRTSNAGHALWSGILDRETAGSVAAQLASPGMLSGWGIRTVDATAPGYNPFGYHRGSVWPHDSAIGLHGITRYGCDADAARVSDAMISLGAANGGQLPELISGIGRDDVSMPVPYAAACRPQAWAAGSILHVVRAMIGLEPDVPNGHLSLRPRLPLGQSITVEGLRLGAHRVSFTAAGSDVTEVDGDGLDVIVGDDAFLAASAWGRSPQAAVRGGKDH